MSLVDGSLFWNLDESNDSFYSIGALLCSCDERFRFRSLCKLSRLLTPDLMHFTTKSCVEGWNERSKSDTEIRFLYSLELESRP